MPLVIDEFRLNTFDVQLTLSQRACMAGERAEGEVAVTYFTGKVAAGAEVEVVAETGDPQPPRIAGTTGPDGVFHFRLPIPKSKSSEYVALRATVADVSGQSYTATDWIRTHAAAFRVRTVASQESAVVGTVVALEVCATDWDDRPIAGATVTAVGASQAQAAVTGRDGRARLQWKVGKTGEQVNVTVVAERQGGPRRMPDLGSRESSRRRGKLAANRRLDRAHANCRRRAAAVQADVPRREAWLGHRGHFCRKRSTAGQPRTRAAAGRAPDRDPHGEELGAQVTLVAVVLDGDEMQSETASSYVHPMEKLLVLQVETDKAEYRPGDPCTVVITARDHRGRPVPRAAISLGVVDQAVYQIREDPLPDLFQTLYEYPIDDPCVGTFEATAPHAESVEFLRGPRYAWGYFPDSLASGRGSGFAIGGLNSYGSASDRISVRRRFETAAHWVADVFTDADGTARVTFRLPDNVTQWRFTARGVTADTLVGGISVTRRTFLPVSVELAVPRGFREGDRIDLPVVLHNNTSSARKVQASTRIAGQSESPPSPSGRGAGGEGALPSETSWPERLLPAGGDFAFTVPLTAVDCRPLELFASVRESNGPADAVRGQLVPLPQYVVVTQRWSGLLDTETPKQPTRDVRAAGSAKLSLSIRREPGLAGSVQSALDELVQYPYGCVEQTMSRFMPAVVAGAAMREAGLKNAASDRLPDVIAAGLARLADFQHADGGWGWWKDDQTNDFMTAYVVEGLARCQRLKQPVPGSMLRRAYDYLLGQVRVERLRGNPPECIGDVDLGIYSVHALAELIGTVDDFERTPVADLHAATHRIAAKQRPPRLLDRVLLADTWRLLDNRSEALAGLNALLPSPSGRGAGGEPQADDRQSIIAAASLLELGAALEPKDRRWGLLARQIVAQRQGTGWGDTLTTSAAVRGLSAVLTPPARETPVTVFLDGRKVGELTAAQGNRLQLQVDRVGDLVLQPAAGSCPDFYTIEVQARCVPSPSTPSGREVGALLTSPSGRGAGALLTSPSGRGAGGEGDPLSPASPSAPLVTLHTRLMQSEPSPGEVLPDASNRLSIIRGRTYELRLEVELKQAVSHARLTLPRPCGVELVRLPPRNGGLVCIDARDDAVHFFIERWEAGRHAIVFPIRAEVGGVVLSPPPELAPMYGDSLPTVAIGPRQIIVGPEAK